jgi:hypothetical protein
VAMQNSQILGDERIFKNVPYGESQRARAYARDGVHVNCGAVTVKDFAGG